MKLSSPKENPAIKDALERAKNHWPKNGDPYYFIDSSMSVEVTDFGGRHLNRAHRVTGNMFKTRERAEAFAEKFRKFLAEHNQIEQ